MAGDCAGAEAANEEALQLGTWIEAPETLAAYGGILATIRECQGRGGEAIDLFAQAACANPAVATLRSGVARLYCGLSRLDEARALFETDAATGFVEFPRDNTWTTSMSFCADAAVVLRDHRAAQLLHEALLPFVNLVAFNGGSVVGAIARPLGRVAHMLGHHAEATRSSGRLWRPMSVSMLHI